MTARQYDREDAADDDEGAPDMVEDDDEPQAYSLKGLGKGSVAPIQRVYGWQISEVRPSSS